MNGEEGLFIPGLDQQQQSLTHYPLFIHHEPLMQASHNQQPISTTLTTAISPVAMMAPTAPMNGAWPSPPHYLPSQLPPAPTLSLPHPSTVSSPIAYTVSPSHSSSSAPSPSPSASSSTSSNKRYSCKKRCQAAIDDPIRYGLCEYKAHSKELKKHYRTTHKKYAEKIGLRLDPVVCPACGSEFAAGRPDFLDRHRKRILNKATGEEGPSPCEKKLARVKEEDDMSCEGQGRGDGKGKGPKQKDIRTGREGKRR